MNLSLVQSPFFPSRSYSPVAKAVLLGILSFSSYLSAEEADKQEQKSTLEVIEVTAQKRVQNILKVPVTVGTVSASTIKESASILLSDVDKFIPGFEFDDSNMTQAGITMRGISSPNISVGGDPSSAVFYDDVYMPRAAQNVLFSDLERIEVLKGPQGTLFGRNAAMGVVNIVPIKPHGDMEGFAKVSLGSDNLQRMEGMFNTPLTDNLYLRANVLSNTQDGLVKNVAEPQWNAHSQVWDLGERDHMAYRISLLWDMSANTNLQLSYDFDDLEQAPPMAIGLSEFAYQGGRDPFANKAENDVRLGVESRDMQGWIAKLNHTFNEQASLKYTLGYRDWQTINREDEDGTADITRYFDTSNNEDSSILYTELQFNYINDRVNAVAGFSYSKERVKQQTELNISTDTVARLVTGQLNDTIQGMVAQQLAQAIGGDTDEAAAAVFGPGVTFDAAVNMQYAELGFPIEHMWQADQWAGALTALGFAEPIMAAIGFPGAPLTADIVNFTGDLTYDLVAQELGDPVIFGPGFSGQFWQENIFNSGDFTNYGIYADVDYQLTDKWHLIAGLRYSHDDKDFSWYIPAPSFAAKRPGVGNLLFAQADQSASENWGKVTGRLVSSYQLNDDQMIFASYSTGYKSGGFDSLVPVDQSQGEQAFEPEDSSNLEFGYKALLWDAVRANISYYQTELDNFQISVESRQPGSQQAIPMIINENRKIKGFEVELQWQASMNTQLGMVTEIRSTDIDTPQFYNASGDLVAAESRSFDTDTNYTLTYDWSPDSELGLIHLHLDYVFVGNTNDQDPGIEDYKLAQPAYFKDRKDLGARLSWANSEQNLEFGLWAHNLLDERYIEGISGRTAATLGTPFGRINRGRELGLDFTYSF
jgi:iron complex outermembrane recepter protein